MPGTDWTFSLAAVADRLSDQPEGGMRFHTALRHGTMRLALYGPREVDGQSPHRQDELYVVAAGSGWFTKNGERRRFAPNDAIFVEAGAEHRFEDFTPDFLTWVVFWGPDGGEGGG